MKVQDMSLKQLVNQALRSDIASDARFKELSEDYGREYALSDTTYKAHVKRYNECREEFALRVYSLTEIDIRDEDGDFEGLSADDLSNPKFLDMQKRFGQFDTKIWVMGNGDWC